MFFRRGKSKAQYIVVESESRSGLEEKVSIKLMSGFICVGGVSHSVTKLHGNEHSFSTLKSWSQAVVKM